MEQLVTFQQYRTFLFAIAYRILGSVTEAEDTIQEVWIRWQNSSSIVDSPKAFLCKIVTRLSIDRLRYLNREKEKYIGIWLPEPLLIQDNNLEFTESISYAFLVLLECLSPTERAVFVLRKVFDYEYLQISKIVSKSTINCRQIFHRARQKIIKKQGKFNLSHQEQNIIIEQFIDAWNRGDLAVLIALMQEDITFYSDGGGKVTALRNPLHGNLKVTRFLLAIKQSKLIPDFTSQPILINGRLGILNTIKNRPQSAISFQFREHKIATIFAVANPDKLII
jgi:RNA polymerase sigma-70 factor (ECF subfamily)